MMKIVMTSAAASAMAHGAMNSASAGCGPNRVFSSSLGQCMPRTGRCDAQQVFRNGRCEWRQGE